MTGLTNGTEYSFQIRAVAGSLPGDASDAVKATPQLAVPDAPTGLSATAGNAEVDLAWTLPTNTSEIVAVQVRWKATVDLPFDNASDKWTDLPSSDATDHKVTGLTNGTGYTFQVRATNKAGNGQRPPARRRRGASGQGAVRARRSGVDPRRHTGHPELDPADRRGRADQGAGAPPGPGRDHLGALDGLGGGRHHPHRGQPEERPGLPV